MRASTQVQLKPYTTRTITVYGQTTKLYHNTAMVMKATSFGQKLLSHRTLVNLKRGKGEGERLHFEFEREINRSAGEE